MKTNVNKKSGVLLGLAAVMVLAALVIGCKTNVSSETSTVAVSGVTLDKATVTLVEQETVTLKATVAPTNATNKKVSWSSDKQDIASVDATGKVTAHKVGEAVVTVKSEDGGKTASCKVTVTAKAPPTPMYAVSFSVDGIGGTLKAKVGDTEIHTGNTVEQGKTVTFTATPNSDYKVKEWKVDDAVVTGNASTTYTHPVTKGVEVKVSFESNSVPPTPPASVPYDFVEISSPAAGITGKDPTYTLPGTGDDWKGVFRAERKVKLSPYKLGKTEVPYKLWKEVYDWAVKAENGYTFANVGKKGSSGSGNEEEPVTTISWRDCIVWCNAYTQMKNSSDEQCVYRKKDDHTVVLKDATDGDACDNAYADMSKKGFRLPTEAEWEYAARWQGSDNTNAEQYGEVWLTKLNSASGAKDKWNTAETGEVAWYRDNSGYKTHPVGEKRSNALGLHDMSGNVWEWCFDWYNSNPTANDAAYTSGGFVVDPQGGASGVNRVVRGGSWLINANDCVVGLRFGGSLVVGIGSFLGFRVAMSKN